MAFIFDGNTQTPDELERLRQMFAQQLAGNGGTASNVGEGLAQLGRALAGRIGLSMTDKKTAGKKSSALTAAQSLFGGSPATPAAPAPSMTSAAPTSAQASSQSLAPLIAQTAKDVGVDPVDLATAISYETAGTFDPTKTGPTTKWGQHRGLIQFGEPQAKQYGVDWTKPVESQLGPGKAVSQYLKAAGVKPGMGMLDLYAAINAGRVGRYNASDAKAGGAPGTVADKVNNQMAGHRAKAVALMSPFLQGMAAPAASSGVPTPPMAPSPSAGLSAPSIPPQMPQMAQAPAQAPAQPNIVPASAPPPQAMRPMTGMERMQMNNAERGNAPDGYQTEQRIRAARMGQPAPAVPGLLAGIFRSPQAAPAAAPGVSAPPMAQSPSAAPGMAPSAAPASPTDRLQQLQGFILSPSFQWLDQTQQALVLEQYKMEQAKLQPKEPTKGVPVDGKIVDPFTGKVIYGGSEKPAAPPQTRQVRIGNQIVTQEWDTTNKAWKEVGKGDAFKTTPDTVVNVGGEPPDGDLRKSLDQAEGKQLQAYKDAAAVSGQSQQDLAILDEIIKVAPQGPITGRLAQAFPGVSSAGAAFQSIVKRIAPTLRAPGSGSTSDIEYEGMLQSLPMLQNNPDANVLIAQIMKDKAALNVKRGEVITQYQTGAIDAKTMRSQLDALNKVSIITPEMKAALSGLSEGRSNKMMPPPANVGPDGRAQEPTVLSKDPAEADQQFNALPSGSFFLAPDGTIRRKP